MNPNPGAPYGWNAPYAPYVAPRPPRRRWPWIVGAIATVVLLAGGVIGAVTLVGRSSSSAGPAGPVTAVAGTGGTVCAIASERLYCLGSNYGSTVGDGTHEIRSAPSTAVAGLRGVTDVAMADRVTCAVARGDVFCWGDNATTLINDSGASPDDTRAPVRVAGISGATSIAVASSNRLGTSACAVTDRGPYCWGAGTSGAVPVRLRGIGAKATAIEMEFSGYAANACALVDGTVHCWAGGTGFDLLEGTPTSIDTPVAIESLARAGFCGLGKGEAYCWKSWSSGGAASGSRWAAELDDVTDLWNSVYGSYFCAVSGGEVYCAAGDDDSGPMTRVEGLTDVSAVTSSGPKCAVSDGYLTCWGDLGWRTGRVKSSDDATLSKPIRIDLPA